MQEVHICTSSHLQGIQVSFLYEGHRVKVKVTGAKKGENAYSRNAKTLIDHNCASIKHWAMRFACSMGLVVMGIEWCDCHLCLSLNCLRWLLLNMNDTEEYVNYCDIVDCIRMTWWVPAAVPQMMKLMKHTVICSLLMYWRLSTWLGEHLFTIL